MPRILGIDASLTASGLARIDVHDNDDGPVLKYSWTIATATASAPQPHKTDKSKRAMARRVRSLLTQLEAAIVDADDIDGFAPDLIAIESLAYGAKGASAWVLPWIFGQVCSLAVAYDIPLLEVSTGQRAKYAAGSGNADKDTVLLAVSKRWPEAGVANNNEADAVSVGAVGCDYLGYPICEQTKYQAEVMAAIRKSVKAAGDTALIALDAAR